MDGLLSTLDSMGIITDLINLIISYVTQTTVNVKLIKESNYLHAFLTFENFAGQTKIKLYEISNGAHEWFEFHDNCLKKQNCYINLNNESRDGNVNGIKTTLNTTNDVIEYFDDHVIFHCSRMNESATVRVKVHVDACVGIFQQIGQEIEKFDLECEIKHKFELERYNREMNETQDDDNQ
jgi:hypothetical protein